MSYAKWRPFCLGLNVLILFINPVHAIDYSPASWSDTRVWAGIIDSDTIDIGTCNILKVIHDLLRNDAQT